MNLKLKCALLACSLIMLSPLEAAKPLDKTLKNSRANEERPSVLQEVHGQMKLLQEQLGSLKAAHQMGSAETIIKTLTPKVHKLEIRLERVEKQIVQVASLKELTALKDDLGDFKAKLHALIKAPDGSVDAALNALNPTLERMQKQVYYLYETVKSQGEKQKSTLNETMGGVTSRIEQFEMKIRDKLTEAQSANTSLNIIRQALQQNHTMINALKVDVEVINNEKMGHIFQEIHNLKGQISKEELIKNMTSIQQQVQKLADVFTKSLTSIGNTHQIAEQGLTLSRQVDQKVKELAQTQEKHLEGLKIVYKRAKVLQDQLDCVKTVVDQGATSAQSKIDQFLTKYPVERTLEQMKVLKEALEKQNAERMDKLQHFEVVFGSVNQNYEKLKKQCLFLYKQMKTSAYTTQVEDFTKQVKDLNEKLSILNTQNISIHHEPTEAHMQEKLDTLQKEVIQLAQKINEKEDVILKLSRRVSFLTKYLQDKLDQGSAGAGQDLGQFKAQIEEKVENELKAVRGDKVMFETLIQRIAALEASLSLEGSEKYLND